MSPNTPAELERLIDRLRAARADHTPLEIRGGGTKRFYGEAPRGEPLELSGLCGISSYEPSELVVTVRAGTPLAELESTLAEQGQWLAFEPPRFAPGGTVGGMLASGLAGPARPHAGAVRDFTLGLTLLNGRAELLRFGGQVMKNVAGYDVSRAMAGSWGILGVICEVSLKVLPVRPRTLTLVFDRNREQALQAFARWAGMPLPLYAGAWFDGRLYVRLAGAAAAVRAAQAQLGGDELAASDAERWWSDLRDHRHVFFTLDTAELERGECLWRLSLPPTTPAFDLDGREFIGWSGAERWWRSAAPAADVRAAAASRGGHATLVRAADKGAGAFAPVAAKLLEIHRALKLAFDPDRILNPGRLYAGL